MTDASEIETLLVQSLDQLIAAVTPKTADTTSGRFRDYAVYRGAADARWRLLTKLHRLGGDAPPFPKLHLERDIIRNFRRYGNPHFTERNISDLELVVLGQHHGLPTRLLDWSYSPLVAGHFATLEPNDAPRVIWRLDWLQVHRHFGLPERALLPEEFEDQLRQRLGCSFAELCSDRGSQTNSNQEHEFVALLDPHSVDQRIVVQSGVFLISTRKDISLCTILKSHGLAGALTKFEIPAACVGRFRDQLDLCSIDERRLFPDLAGVCQEMTRYYS